MSYITTNSGKNFDYLKLDVDNICIEDIACALSKICRFAGHTNKFYSVAQHATLVSFLVSPEYAWEALHHDDTEAYMVDIPTPLKNLLSQYGVMEQKVHELIAQKFNVPKYVSDEVKVADYNAYKIERFYLMNNPPEWIEQHKKLAGNYAINPLEPKDAEALFLRFYYNLLYK